uniref:McrC family protein n=1 Tax=Cucumibacter marinus TaxID=1121252 RepID=UPI00056768A5
IRDGLPRHYRHHEDDLPALRGSLDMVRQFTRHAVNPSRLACRFDALTEDIALNRLIMAALTQLSRLARHPANRQQLGALLDLYDGVSAITPSAGRRVKVLLDRTNRKWADLVALARLVLSGQYQSTTHGGQAGFALLFEMNALFEAYCTRMLTRSLAATPYTVKRQGGRRSCLTDNRTGAPVFETRPDILVRRGDDIVHIIDTKWKRMARPDRDPDPKCGMAQGDVYQVMAYAGLYEVSRLTLLYPHHAGLGEADGVKARFGINPGQAQLAVASIDLTDPDTIRERLRRLVIDQVPDRG